MYVIYVPIHHVRKMKQMFRAKSGRLESTDTGNGKIQRRPSEAPLLPLPSIDTMEKSLKQAGGQRPQEGARRRRNNNQLVCKRNPVCEPGAACRLADLSWKNRHWNSSGGGPGWGG